MAHPNVALNVKGWSASEPKRLHVGIDQGLVHGVIHPQGPLKLRDEFLVHGTPVMIYQLDLFVRPVVGLKRIDKTVHSVQMKLDTFM